MELFIINLTYTCTYLILNVCWYIVYIERFQLNELYAHCTIEMKACTLYNDSRFRRYRIDISNK